MLESYDEKCEHLARIKYSTLYTTWLRPKVAPGLVLLDKDQHTAPAGRIPVSEAAY